MISMLFAALVGTRQRSTTLGSRDTARMVHET
jgi:hypothetical protein